MNIEALQSNYHGSEDVFRFFLALFLTEQAIGLSYPDRRTRLIHIVITGMGPSTP